MNPARVTTQASTTIMRLSRVLTVLGNWDLMDLFDSPPQVSDKLLACRYFSATFELGRSWSIRQAGSLSDFLCCLPTTVKHPVVAVVAACLRTTLVKK